VAAIVAWLTLGNRKTAPGSTGTPGETSQPTASADSATTTKTAGQPTAVQNNSAGSENDPLDLPALLQKLKDPALDATERKRVISALAKNCSTEAIAALKDAFANGSPELKRTVAEALGDCSSPDAAAMLLGLLRDSDQSLAEAAIRGLGKQGSPEAANALGQLLNDKSVDSELRSEAALALGGVNQPGVVDSLAQAARGTDDEELVKAILSALGERDFSETQPFFQAYLHSADVSSELRVAAVEALAQASGDPTSLLTELAADPDVDVRVAAAWGLSATEITGSSGAQILSMLSSEAEGDVRLRLYQALRNQDSFDTSAALSLIQGEKDPSARVAALDLAAKVVRDQPGGDFQNFFNSTAIPELKQIAMSANNYDDRQSAIIALTRAHTPEATAALKDIGNQLAAQQAAAAPPPAVPATPGAPKHNRPPTH